MRKLSLSALILCLILGTAVVAMAKDATKTAKGAVTAVDPAGNSLSVKGTTGDWTFMVTATTKIEKAGKPIKLADVKVGDDVTVWYMTNAGKNEASKIIVHVMKAPPAKPAK